jgi:signal transduction histidine kinase
MEASPKILDTLTTGSMALVFFVIIIILVVLRYQNRKRALLIETQRLKHETDSEVLKLKLEAQEETMNQISRELHDNIGQLMNSSKLFVGITKRALPNTIDELNLAEDTISKAIIELRALSKSLNKDWLQKFNFIENLSTEAKRIEATNQFEISVSHPDSIDLPVDRQLILFRIVQEAIQNSLKHAEASRLQITAQQQNSMLTVAVEDNGKGFDLTDSAKPGLGMNTIKHRAALMRGTAKWTSGRQGTCVKIEIPINNQV